MDFSQHYRDIDTDLAIFGTNHLIFCVVLFLFLVSMKFDAMKSTQCIYLFVTCVCVIVVHAHLWLLNECNGYVWRITSKLPW